MRTCKPKYKINHIPECDPENLGRARRNYYGTLIFQYIFSSYMENRIERIIVIICF